MIRSQHENTYVQDHSPSPVHPQKSARRGAQRKRKCVRIQCDRLSKVSRHEDPPSYTSIPTRTVAPARRSMASNIMMLGPLTVPPLTLPRVTTLFVCGREGGYRGGSLER